ncbi:alcohol dehydrogenase GroES domain protein [Candidatus Vecturithrix granuli]|uniref:Alcohol dehydrogenase GroES domain protein n=1 Tax=Vecturithrix granuli TaxID=1499967 RepID=A0A081BV10_VECG1|nr:alcohol dehydrogenase GroES domain protein [Candidatus Vecturithrix granuli]
MNTIYVPIFKGEGRIEYENRPIPKIMQPNEVLVKIDACGICGTDMNILAVPPAHKATHGVIIGHEGVGTIAEIGPAVSDLQPGDRVVIAPRLTCGKCVYCRKGLDNQCINYQTIGTTIDGAFAPYVCAPQQAFYKIGNDVAPDDALFFEPLSCVVGAAARIPFQAGDAVAIIGAGPMGLLFAQMYRTLGAGKILVADISAYRLDFAQKIGVDAALNPMTVDLAEEVKKSTGIGADLVIDAVGNQIDAAIKLVRRGGNVLLFGLRPHDNPPVNQYTITRYDLTIHGAFVGLKPFEQTIKLLQSGRIHPSTLITHRVPLTELLRGVELMRSGQAMKVIVEN